MRPGVRFQAFAQQLRVGTDLRPGHASVAVSHGHALSNFGCLLACTEYMKGGL